LQVNTEANAIVNWGTTPISPNGSVKLPVGKALLTVTQRYFDDFKQEINNKPNNKESAPTKIGPNLIRQKADLTINSTPTGASVYLNGSYVGKTPYSKKTKQPGVIIWN